MIVQLRSSFAGILCMLIGMSAVLCGGVPMRTHADGGVESLVQILLQLETERVGVMENVEKGTPHAFAALSEIEQRRTETSKALQEMQLSDAQRQKLETYREHVRGMLADEALLQAGGSLEQRKNVLTNWREQERRAEDALRSMATSDTRLSSVLTQRLRDAPAMILPLVTQKNGLMSILLIVCAFICGVCLIRIRRRRSYLVTLKTLASQVTQVRKGAAKRIEGNFSGVMEDIAMNVNQFAEKYEALKNRYSEDIAKEVAEKTARLQMESRRMTEVIEGSSDAIAAIDLEYRYIAFNRSYEREFRKMYADAKLSLGMSVIEDALAQYPDERDKAKLLWDRALQGEEFSCRLDTGDRSLGWRSYDIAYSTIRDERSKPIGATMVMRDVTERRLAEEELKKAKEQVEEEAQNAKKFQLAVESSTDAICITSADANLVYVNPAWERLTGYTRTEVLGKNVKILRSDKTAPAVLDAMREAVKFGRDCHREDLVNRRKDGSEFAAELTFYPILKNEAVQLFVGILHDITQRKRTEQAQSEFVSLASHQLRTPLTAIRLVLGAFARGEAAALPDDAKALVTRALEYAVHMSDTIHTMLNISRLEAGKVKLQPSEFFLLQLIEGIRGDHQLESKRRKQTVEVHCRADLQLQTDLPLLKEAITNLLTNSIKYTPDEGTISIDVIEESDFVRIAVTDTGYGIPLHQQDKIFTKFFRAENVIRVETSGTGLGLYLVHQLMRLLHGSVSFTSKENEGTTFTLFLPLSHPTV